MILLYLAMLGGLAMAEPDGAPEQACSHMYPEHFVAATDADEYSISAEENEDGTYTGQFIPLSMWTKIFK